MDEPDFLAPRVSTVSFADCTFLVYFFICISWKFTADPDMGSSLILLAGLSVVFVKTIGGTAYLVSLFVILAVSGSHIFFQCSRRAADSAATEAPWCLHLPVSSLPGGAGLLTPDVWECLCAKGWAPILLLEISEAPVSERWA